MGYRIGWLGLLGIALAWSVKAEMGGELRQAQFDAHRQPLHREVFHGRGEKETRAAIRHYQILHGLPASGVADEETLRRLDPTPQERLIEADRRFLRTLPGG